jgi:hypothetical protein
VPACPHLGSMSAPGEAECAPAASSAAVVTARPAVTAGLPSSAAAAAAAAVEAPIPVPVVGPAVMRCAGLEYANMKKEEAREQYKERRRNELLSAGEVDRVKRRKKNDGGMTDTQKYSRRLKMNQDSAAAARAAQEAYVATLERLVEAAEAEESMLALEAGSLRDERDLLAQRLNGLHYEVVASLSTVPGVPPAVAPPPIVEGASTAGLLRKMMELFSTDGNAASAVTNDADFAKEIMGTVPAPAV